MLSEHLEHQIYQCLVEADPVSASNINVKADGSQVWLRGSVASWREMLAAHSVVSRHPDVKTLQNLLVVEGVNGIGDQQLINQIAESLVDSRELVAETIMVDAGAGKVTLTGYVSSERQNTIATDVAMSCRAVRKVNNLLMLNPDYVVANLEHSRAIHAGLRRVVELANESLRIAVVDESAQLTGSVDTTWKKELAETEVRRFNIISVANHILTGV